MQDLVIYDTKYGSTKQIAETIGQVLEMEALSVETIDDLQADFVVLGCPIYAGKLLPSMIDFLTVKKEVLKKKKVALFIVCGDQGTVTVQGEETGGKAYLKEIKRFLEVETIAEKAFLGKMKKSLLKKEDQEILEGYSNILGVQFPDFDGLDLEEARKFAEDIKAEK